jgi:ectoine hydroxylase-related dioxygenase (phytanoyl-CoA dioxygenase family)
MADLRQFADLGVDPDPEAYYARWGFVVLRGVLDPAVLDALEAQCVAAQGDVLAGALPERYGSTKFLDDAAKARRFVNYVEHVEELAPAVGAALATPAVADLLDALLGPHRWPARGGVVYQDARPGRESGYSRIGWHADWQAVPHLDIWPGTAFTLHLDATGPDNGFLRVVPGSHRWATPTPYENVNGAVVPDGAPPARGHTDEAPPVAMPPGFGKVRGEVPVYCERGDVLLHDAYLWHSAARATDDATVRRHVRGGFQGGDPALADVETGFVKNAAR